jgi:hypothetical protein
MKLQRIKASDRAGWRADRIVAGLLLACLGTQSFALGLGEPNVSSVLGQPLQMTLPLVMDPGTGLAQECVKIIPGSPSGEQTPTLNAARLTVDPVGRSLKIESLAPIVEPTLRVVVELGCNERIRREFALLLDPPVVAPNVAAAGSNLATSSLGLGMAQISAVIGQRLSIKVPVLGSDASGLTASCVRLADPIVAEGAPVLKQAEIRVVPHDSGSLIEVATPDPVSEPAVRIALDVGCRDPLRREYAIMLGMPALAASDADTTVAAAEPSPHEAPPSPAPRRTTLDSTSAPPVAPHPRPARSTSASALETPAKAAQAPAPGPDRLVLSSPQDSIGPIAANADSRGAVLDQSAELVKRMDEMSRQIAALQAQLVASRQREQQLEHRAFETREQWTWSAGALGGLLLGGALVLAWRQRRPMPRSTWESVTTQTAPITVSKPVPARGSVSPAARESSEIAGRATMPPSSSMGGSTTEPSLADEKHAQITVTELHDTVQVIKELYATVLEQNTVVPATSGNKLLPRPLDLDLRTPTRMGPATASPAAGAAQEHADAGQQHAIEERFTELPTEVSLDLDLNTTAAATPELTDLLVPGNIDRSAPRTNEPAAAASPPVPTAPTKEAQGAGRAPEASPPVADLVYSEGAGRREISDDQLTQTPTEVSIDIDVGTATNFASTVGRSGPRLHPQRLEAERSRNAPAPLEPIDLQLDLNQSQTKSKLRSA